MRDSRGSLAKLAPLVSSRRDTAVVIDQYTLQPSGVYKRLRWPRDERFRCLQRRCLTGYWLCRLCVYPDHDNWQRIESKFSADNSGVSTLSLTGVSFTAVVCDSLFIWGNALFFRYWFSWFISVQRNKLKPPYIKDLTPSLAFALLIWCNLV